MDDGYPSRDMVKTFDLDFGRVGVQTCFDMNFVEGWQQLYASNVDLVFWPATKPCTLGNHSGRARGH